MKCVRCDKNLRKVELSNGFHPVYVKYTEKGMFGQEYSSPLNAYVCPKCGHMEFIAEKPEVFERVEINE